MKAKEYLQQLQRLDTVINQKIKELDGLRAALFNIGSIDYSKERVQISCSGGAPFVNLTGRILDLEAEIDKEIDGFVNKKHQIINQIQGLSNATHIQVLFKRYVEFKRLEVVAVEMGYTYQYTRDLHGNALRNFERSYTNLQ